MTVLHFIRRAHLYMGLFLLPWVVMFGVSSIPLNHNSTPDPAQWRQVAAHPFVVDMPPAGADLRAFGRHMMDAAGIGGGYFVNRANTRQINVNHPDFLRPIRIIYHADRGHLIVEEREFRFRQFLGGLHTRGGYDMGGFWDSVWAVFVDAVCIALVLWIATGIYMWWHLPSTRVWGWTALATGAFCFAFIIFSL